MWFQRSIAAQFKLLDGDSASRAGCTEELLYVETVLFLQQSQEK